MDDCGLVSDSRGTAGFVFTEIEVPDTSSAVGLAGALETSTGDGGATPDVGLEFVGTKSGVTDGGSRLFCDSFVGAGATTGACKGTSTVARASIGCS